MVTFTLALFLTTLYDGLAEGTSELEGTSVSGGLSLPDDALLEGALLEEGASVIEGAASAGLSSPAVQGIATQLTLAFILLVAFYVFYLLYKHVLRGRGGRRGAFAFGKSRHMQILEITSVGPGSTIQLVKVSEEYFLVGVTKSQISFLTKVDGSPIQETLDKDGPGAFSQRGVFDSLLGRLVKGRQSADHSDDKNRDNSSPPDA